MLTYVYDTTFSTMCFYWLSKLTLHYNDQSQYIHFIRITFLLLHIYWNMTLSDILFRSAAKIQMACICLFINNCADYIQCNSSLLCLQSEHQDWLLLAAAAHSGSEMWFSGVSHFYFPTSYCFQHMILEGFLGLWDIGSWFQHLIVRGKNENWYASHLFWGIM